MGEVGKASASWLFALRHRRKSLQIQRRAARASFDFLQGPSKPAAIMSPERNWRRIEMNQLIYLIGLIVVILAILSFFGLR